MVRISLICLVMVSLGASSALGDREPFSEADIGRMRERAKGADVDGRAFTDLVKAKAAEMRKEAEALAATAAVNRPRPGKTGAGASASGMDFDGLVSRAGEMAQQHEQGPQLIAFVSFSVPPAALRRIVEDVSAVGGAVVFRGLPQNSVKAFQTQLLEILGTRQSAASIGVDPRLFRAFDVQRVPEFVVVSTGFDLCDGFECRSVVPPHDRLSGNVSLRYALEMVGDGSGPGSAVSRVLLRRLEQRGGGS